MKSLNKYSLGKLLWYKNNEGLWDIQKNNQSIPLILSSSSSPVMFFSVNKLYLENKP